MQISLLAVGKLKKDKTQILFDEYYKRLNIAKSIGLHPIIFEEIASSKLTNAELRRQNEAQKLSNFIDDNSILILCDEKGKNFTSRQFALSIKNYIDSNYKKLIFVIGGADGFAPEFKQRADLLISFGSMTWPHQFARIMLMEQLYRATTIILNHPYHRD